MSKVYLINDVPYYRRGGKYIKKYQVGGFKDAWNKVGDMTIPGGGVEVDTFNSVANTAGNFLSGLNRRDDRASYGRYADKTMSGYQNKGLQTGLSSALSVAGQFDPTLKIVDSAVKIGKGIGDAIGQRDQYGITKSGAQQVGSAIFDPLGNLQQSVNIGKKHGVGQGLLNQYTFGLTGRNLMKDDLKKARRRDEEDSVNMRQGITAGNYKNNSIYARDGLMIEPRYKTPQAQQPNVEVEDGEILLGDPSAMRLYGDSTSSLNSRYATMVHGDKHGEDTDKDGHEGIPMQVQPGTYVASNYLGVDGKKAKNGKTVAKEIEPYVKALAEAADNPEDTYKNNPIVLAHNQMEIANIVDEAEKNKQTQAMVKQVKQLKSNLKSNSMYNFFQEGGMPMQGPQGQQQDPSTQHMQMLAQQQMQGQGGLSPEEQQILAQLPPEVQAEISKLPADQQKIAIQMTMQQMQQGQQGQGDPLMQGAPGPNDAGMQASQQVADMQSQDPNMLVQPPMRKGGVVKQGCKVKFQMGGKVYSGTVKSIDQDGNVELY